jgi:choline/carnitine/betaine transport
MPTKDKDKQAKTGKTGGFLDPAVRMLRHVSDPVTPSTETIHPALIPGIGVETKKYRFHTNWSTFIVALAFVLAVIGWGLISPESFAKAADAALNFVTVDFGWLFQILTLAVFLFMMWLGFGPYRAVKLGRDDEKPEFSTASWVAMLFSAGIGIGLLFYGPLEPMTFFKSLPPAFADVAPDTAEAMRASLVQTLFHWGPVAWAYYALVGGAVAYVAFRKGRLPLMSSLLEPIFGDKTTGPLGAIVDASAILVTLFGTAQSLGIGALQIGRGIEVVAGIGPLGNGVIIAIIALLSVAFIASAVSGLKRGIRALSNINMVIAGLLGVFVFIAGPTLLLLNLAPSVLAEFVWQLPNLFAQSGASGPDAQAFMSGWTTYYWAWWITWAPFVGLFIAKISRGRTLRSFVVTVVLVPSLVCLLWFTVIGGTSMWFESTGAGLSAAASGEDMLFQLFENLPWPQVISVLALISIFIFFVTTADSASVVMSSLSQRGNPHPSRWNTIVWGASLSIIAIVLLMGRGNIALSSLRSLVTVAALPFSIVIILIMISWGKELARDPVMIRRRYAREAMVLAVRNGIEEHGDDFVVSIRPSEPGEGAGAWLDRNDATLTDWYVPESELSETAPVPDVDETEE